MCHGVITANCLGLSHPALRVCMRVQLKILHTHACCVCVCCLHGLPCDFVCVSRSVNKHDYGQREREGWKLLTRKQLGKPSLMWEFSQCNKTPLYLRGAMQHMDLFWGCRGWEVPDSPFSPPFPGPEREEQGKGNDCCSKKTWCNT